MSRINLSERNESALFTQVIRYKENIAQEMEKIKKEKITVNSNETAKREMATELMLQGFSEEAICRILNISPEKILESLQF